MHRHLGRSVLLLALVALLASGCSANEAPTQTAEPYKVTVAGDSISFGLGPAVREQVATRPNSQTKVIGVGGTGLARPDNVDWPGRLETLARVNAMAGAEHTLTKGQRMRRLRAECDCDNVPAAVADLADPRVVANLLEGAREDLARRRQGTARRKMSVITIERSDHDLWCLHWTAGSSTIRPPAACTRRPSSMSSTLG